MRDNHCHYGGTQHTLVTSLAGSLVTPARTRAVGRRQLLSHNAPCRASTIHETKHKFVTNQTSRPSSKSLRRHKLAHKSPYPRGRSHDLIPDHHAEHVSEQKPSAGGRYLGPRRYHQAVSVLVQVRQPQHPVRRRAQLHSAAARHEHRAICRLRLNSRFQCHPHRRLGRYDVHSHQLTHKRLGLLTAKAGMLQ